ncbi:MAG TPA: GNAT family N-acetyltransferase [Acidimicrobiia bacterium]|nr:GNAT family N-acetyltransferase [Acidimicrobiia bacterium]
MSVAWATEIRRDPKSFVELSEWWDRQQAVLDCPFLHSGILGRWKPEFERPNGGLQLRLLKRDGELVAALPLYRARGLAYTLSRNHADWIDVVAIDDEEVRAYLPRWLNSVAMAYLHGFREDSPVVAAASEHPRWVVQKELPSPYVDLSQGIEAVRSGWSRNFHRSLRRRRRRLEELGPVTYVDHPRPEEIEQVLNKGLRIEVAGWKGRKGVAVLNRPDYEHWYRSLAQVAQDKGWLRLSALYLDQRMLSFSFDLQYGKRRFTQLSGYDEDIAGSLSTGSLLLEEIIGRSVSDGLESYEFGFGAERWKQDWTKRERRVFDLLVFGAGGAGRALAAARRVKKRRSLAHSAGADQ